MVKPKGNILHLRAHKFELSYNCINGTNPRMKEENTFNGYVLLKISIDAAIKKPPEQWISEIKGKDCQNGNVNKLGVSLYLFPSK